MRMGRKRERECSPWKKGENECAMSAPRNQDRMVPPSNATPSRGGPEGGGVPVQTESPDTSVSGGGRPDLVARKASPSTCPHGASPGAQASTRVPKATVYPGVSTHWTSSLEWLQNRRRRGASEREKGHGEGRGGRRGRRRRCLRLARGLVTFIKNGKSRGRKDWDSGACSYPRCCFCGARGIVAEQAAVVDVTQA